MYITSANDNNNPDDKPGLQFIISEEGYIGIVETLRNVFKLSYHEETGNITD